MKPVIWLTALAVSLTGCAAIPKIFDSIFGQARQAPTRTPLYVYRADLFLGIEGKTFDGIGVTKVSNQTDIDVTSQIHLDRVEVETCARQEVCQNGKACNGNFEGIETGWFGSTGKHLIYHFVPSDIERLGSCPIYFRVFDKAALAAWGFVAFRSDEDLPAHFTCNGMGWRFAGHSVCQTKAGLIQRIQFDAPIEEADLDDQCNAKKIDDRTWELRPQIGLCTGKFYSKGLWHGLDLIAYDEVLVRGI